MFRLKDLLQLKYMGLYSIKKAQKILTISEFSKKEIVKYYNYPEKDIVVTYPGVNNFKYQISNIKFQISKVTGKYILFVGTVQPRKNIQRLIGALEQLDEDIQLVIVGKKGWLYESIFAAIAKSSKKENIVYLDYVTEDTLVHLYQNALCFVLPSLYEGFGLPVVEAMNYGCPVVVSNTTSLPEVAGDVGIYVNPEDVTDIAQGLKKALQLTKKDRESIVRKGKEQAQKFTWENCARKTIDVLNSFAL